MRHFSIPMTHRNRYPHDSLTHLPTQHDRDSSTLMILNEAFQYPTTRLNQYTHDSITHDLVTLTEDTYEVSLGYLIFRWVLGMPHWVYHQINESPHHLHMISWHSQRILTYTWFCDTLCGDSLIWWYTQCGIPRTHLNIPMTRLEISQWLIYCVILYGETYCFGESQEGIWIFQWLI